MIDLYDRGDIPPVAQRCFDSCKALFSPESNVQFSMINTMRMRCRATFGNPAHIMIDWGLIETIVLAYKSIEPAVPVIGEECERNPWEIVTYLEPTQDRINTWSLFCSGEFAACQSALERALRGREEKPERPQPAISKICRTIEDGDTAAIQLVIAFILGHEFAHLVIHGSHFDELRSDFAAMERMICELHRGRGGMAGVLTLSETLAYLQEHGFSSSREDMSPLSEEVMADHLGRSVAFFCARLLGLTRHREGILLALSLGIPMMFDIEQSYHRQFSSKPHKQAPEIRTQMLRWGLRTGLYPRCDLMAQDTHLSPSHPYSLPYWITSPGNSQDEDERSISIYQALESFDIVIGAFYVSGKMNPILQYFGQPSPQSHAEAVARREAGDFDIHSLKEQLLAL